MIPDCMNFLKVTIYCSLALIALPLSAQDGGYDHESLTTKTGQVYHDISVLDADAHGLMFRHRNGIAKISFVSLPDSYRMLYETGESLDKAANSSQPTSSTSTKRRLSWVPQGFSHGIFVSPIAWQTTDCVSSQRSPFSVVRYGRLPPRAILRLAESNYRACVLQNFLTQSRLSSVQRRCDF